MFKEFFIFILYNIIKIIKILIKYQLERKQKEIFKLK